MDNSFAVRPAIEIEYALTRKFALTAYSNFFITSINSELRTPVGRFANEWNATSFQTGVGVMVYPFR
jgi:cytochrome bd-type quinol oxidase subunit 1